MTQEHLKQGSFSKYFVYSTVCTLLGCHSKAVKLWGPCACMERTATGIHLRDHLKTTSHFWRADAITNERKSAAACEAVLWSFASLWLKILTEHPCLDDFIHPHPRSYLLPDYVLVDVGREQRGWGQKSRVHGGHDGGSHGSDANDGHVGGGEKLQGNGKDWARLVALIWGGQAIASGVPVWQGKRNVGKRRRSKRVPGSGHQSFPPTFNYMKRYLA